MKSSLLPAIWAAMDASFHNLVTPADGQFGRREKSPLTKRQQRARAANRRARQARKATRRRR